MLRTSDSTPRNVGRLDQLLRRLNGPFGLIGAGCGIVAGELVRLSLHSFFGLLSSCIGSKSCIFFSLSNDAENSWVEKRWRPLLCSAIRRARVSFGFGLCSADCLLLT